MNPNAKSSIVIATRNRRERLLQTLAHLEPLEEVAKIVVADNASTDGTARAVNAVYPNVNVLQLRKNTGAFARTLAAREVSTPYIAFCDDDTLWLPGSIAIGAEIFDRYPSIGLLNACVKVGNDERIDDACALMAAARPDSMPGMPILFFLAGAALMRRRAFLECGGYEPRFFIGSEETLLALDFHRAGWRLRYVPSMTVRHDPSSVGRDDALRRRLVMRNRLWVAWMRYRRSSAWRATTQTVRRAWRDEHARAAVFDALRGLPWAMCRRRPIGARLQRLVDGAWSLD